MSDRIAINHTDEKTHGAYRADLPGSPTQAELTWIAQGDARVITHTFVPPEMRGGGVALQLMEAIVADAREQGFKLIPQCSYAAIAFRRHPEWADLLADTPD